MFLDGVRTCQPGVAVLLVGCHGVLEQDLYHPGEMRNDCECLICTVKNGKLIRDIIHNS